MKTYNEYMIEFEKEILDKYDPDRKCREYLLYDMENLEPINFEYMDAILNNEIIVLVTCMNCSLHDIMNDMEMMINETDYYNEYRKTFKDIRQAVEIRDNLIASVKSFNGKYPMVFYRNLGSCFTKKDVEELLILYKESENHRQIVEDTLKSMPVAYDYFFKRLNNN